LVAHHEVASKGQPQRSLILQEDELVLGIGFALDSNDADQLLKTSNS
jgi:hypothetical protein